VFTNIFKEVFIAFFIQYSSIHSFKYSSTASYFDDFVKIVYMHYIHLNVCGHQVCFV